MSIECKIIFTGAWNEFGGYFPYVHPTKKNFIKFILVSISEFVNYLCIFRCIASVWMHFVLMTQIRPFARSASRVVE
jgi:hypothetical protein